MFLAKLAEEHYPDWATWADQILPGCETRYVHNHLEIVEELKRLQEEDSDFDMNNVKD